MLGSPSAVIVEGLPQELGGSIFTKAVFALDFGIEVCGRLVGWNRNDAVNNSMRRQT